MSTKWRRFEVMLPRHFNDGREVPGEWISKAILEIGDHFGPVSYETQIIEGHWQQAGVVYRDDLARIIVDVPRLQVRDRQWISLCPCRYFAMLGAGVDRFPTQPAG